MGCGCGGRGAANPASPTVNPGAVTREDVEYLVTYPNGQRQSFDTESEAYHAIRLTGGGVTSRPRTPSS